MNVDSEDAEGILWNPEEWEWHIADPELQEKILHEVKLLPAKLVKSSDVRSVFRFDDLYLKLEHPETPLRQLKSRLFPKAAAEFEIAQELKAANVPTVEYLGWGCCGSRNMVISREFPGADSVYDCFYRNFVYGNGQYEEFVEMLTDFLREFFRSGFYHDDLHFGNILYSAEMGQMLLVDLIDIRKEDELTESELHKMQRSILELREGLAEEDMLLAITACGIAINTQAAREFFLDEVAADAMRRLNEWPKRRKQILDGYHKFVNPLIENDTVVMLAKNQLRKELLSVKKWHNPESKSRYERREYESEKQAEKIFLRSMFLQLCKIPHRKVAAWQLPGALYFEPLEEVEFETLNSSALEFFTATLAAQEIVAPAEVIAETRFGRFMLTDIEKVETLID